MKHSGLYNALQARVLGRRRVMEEKEASPGHPELLGSVCEQQTGGPVGCEVTFWERGK